MRKYRLLSLMMIILIIACAHHPSQKAQGYIEGHYTYMATSVSGVLKQLLVTRGAPVKSGQLLFVLEAQPESDAYHAAEENLHQAIAAREAAEANVTYARLTYERDKILVPKRAIQQAELDRVKSLYDANVAELAEAEASIAEKTAQLAEAEWTKDQKKIYAPVNARVFDIYYRLGEYTAANQAILSLLAPQDIKVIFYVNEKNLGALKLNDVVEVACDTCTHTYLGHIRFISPTAEYTPPVIYSNETNDKLIYRIEAEFSLEDAVLLHPGQPVDVRYDG